jgi:hypothetical protein
VLSLATPVLKVMLMNPANGKTITGNLTRPAKIIANPDGSTTVLGRGTSKSLSRQMRRRAPGCLVCSSLPARRRQCSRRTGNISLSLHGHVPVDVCAALS